MPWDLDASTAPGTQTAASILRTARRLLNDSASVRWSDDTMVEYMNDGLRELYQVRPDIFLQTTDSMPAVETLTVAAVREGYQVAIGEEWRRPLANFMAGQAWLENDDDPRALEKGARFIEQFNAAMGR